MNTEIAVTIFITIDFKYMIFALWEGRMEERCILRSAVLPKALYLAQFKVISFQLGSRSRGKYYSLGNAINDKGIWNLSLCRTRLVDVIPAACRIVCIAQSILLCVDNCLI